MDLAVRLSNSWIDFTSGICVALPLTLDNYWLKSNERDIKYGFCRLYWQIQDE